MVIFMAYYQHFSLSKGKQPHVTIVGCTLVGMKGDVWRWAGVTSSDNGSVVTIGGKWWPTFFVLEIISGLNPPSIPLLFLKWSITWKKRSARKQIWGSWLLWWARWKEDPTRNLGGPDPDGTWGSPNTGHLCPWVFTGLLWVGGGWTFWFSYHI